MDKIKLVDQLIEQIRQDFFNTLDRVYPLESYHNGHLPNRGTLAVHLMSVVGCAARAGFDAAESIANAKIQELEQRADIFRDKASISEEENKRLLQRVNELEQQLKKAESVIEKFITKSNGLSIYARSEAERTLLEKHYKDLVGRIFDLYDFQCEIEQYLKSRGEK